MTTLPSNATLASPSREALEASMSTATLLASAPPSQPIRLRFLYPIVGALVGLAIEAGLLAVRLIDSAAPLSWSSVQTEIADGASTYVYLAVVLSSALAILGAALGRKEDALRLTSVTDSLTRVVNRRGFDEALALEVARSCEADMPLSLLILDVDHFKSLNDEYGHKTGDLALRTVADVLRVSCRSRDLPARFGGDEFVVLAPRTTAAEASILAERIRVALATLTPASAIGRPISVSIGVADLSATRDATPAGLLDAADRALYRAKTAGRGRVVQLPTLHDGDVEDEETITKVVRCSPPSEPCAEDSNLFATVSLERMTCAANTNLSVSERPSPRTSEIRPVAPLAKTHGEDGADSRNAMPENTQVASVDS